MIGRIIDKIFDFTYAIAQILMLLIFWAGLIFFIVMVFEEMTT